MYIQINIRLVRKFRFQKNERGYSDFSFRLMRNLVIPVIGNYCAPRMINRENMPVTGPCFIYANHSNNFDPFVINYHMKSEPTAGVMTRYQFYKVIPRIFMDSIGVVPTSKYVPEPGIIRNVMKLAEQNRMITIFPEGGRRWDGRPKPLIEATLKLFWKMRIAVHPVQIHGSYLGWPRWADRPRKNSMELHWMHPLYPDDFDSYTEFADRCTELIRFDEYNPPESTLPVSANKPALGIQKMLYRCPYSGVPGSVHTPDGHRVFSRTSGDFSFTMDKDSRLVDHHGERHSVIKLYDEISTMPVLKDRQSVVIPGVRCQIYKVDESHQLKNAGYGYIKLVTDAVEIQEDAGHQTIYLDDIMYISIEKNHKLLLTTEKQSLMLNLGDQSALQWQNHIRRLQKGEPAVTSL